VELDSLDAYRAKHSGSALHDSGWRRPIGFNVGFLALATRQDLLDRVGCRPRSLSDLSLSRNYLKEIPI